MSKRDLDLILRTAFNDQEDGDDAMIKEWLAQDQAAQSELKNMESLKVGLKSLADVPECQLSSERLREAILTQGVKPNRPAAYPWWKFALPAAAVAAVAWLVVPNLHLDRQPQLSGSTAVAKNEATIVDPAQLNESAVASKSDAARETVSGLLDRAIKPQDIDKRPVLDSAPTPARTIANRRSDRGVTRSQPETRAINHVDVAKLATKVASLVTDHVSGSIESPQMDAPPAAASMVANPSALNSGRGDQNNSRNIVVVETQGQTAGPPRAVEMQNNDVVFGG